MWLKEGLSIENKPGYRTSLQNGLCKLAIEEVFTTDSATFTCRATNEAGTTDTTAFLTVLGTFYENEICISMLKFLHYYYCYYNYFEFFF